MLFDIAIVAKKFEISKHQKITNMRYPNPLRPYKAQIMLGLIIGLIALAASCFGQSITFAQAENLEYAKLLSNNTEFQSYQSQDGSLIKIGDTLMIGVPSTKSNSFSHIYMGKVTLGSALFVTPVALGMTYQKEKVVVDKITCMHAKMSKNSPLKISVFVSNSAYASIAKNRTILDYEKAFVIGEIINPKAMLTREQAIAKLKETKDLLDLGMINQSKFDSVKNELTPIIMKKP